MPTRRESQHSSQAISYEYVLVCVAILVKKTNAVKSTYVRMDAILDFDENFYLTKTSVGITIFFSDMLNESILSPFEHSLHRAVLKIGQRNSTTQYGKSLKNIIIDPLK